MLANLPQRSSLVSQTTRILLEEMRAGRWRRWLPGEHELAKALRVSRVTLRAALAQLEREGWLKTSQGRRREITVSQRANKNLTAGNRVILLTPAPLQSLPAFTVYWMDALREQLGDHGLYLDIQVHQAAYAAKSAHALQQLTESQQAMTWVLYCSTRQMQKHFAAQELPCVITGSRHPGIELPSLDTDYRAACRHAAGLFLSRGHHRLVLLNPETGTGGELESEQGFLQAIPVTQTAEIEAKIVRHDGTVPGICTCLDKLFRSQRPPTALLVSRPMHALTTLGHSLRRGIRLPGDVALIARDTDAFLEHMVPSVARYSSEPVPFAQKLSRLVLGIAQNGRVTQEPIRLMPRFISGETLG